MLKRKKLLHNINFTKQITRTVEQRLADQRVALERKKKQQAEYYKDGLAGKRMGSKYKAEKGEIDVQLSEDLSESLRGLKVGVVDSILRRIADRIPGGRESFPRPVSQFTAAWIGGNAFTTEVGLLSLPQSLTPHHVLLTTLSILLLLWQSTANEATRELQDGGETRVEGVQLRLNLIPVYWSRRLYILLLRGTERWQGN